MFRGGAATLCLIALAGCASVDRKLLDKQLPAPPAAWTANSDVGAAPIGDWVAAFDDPQLYSLIKEAMAHNNTLLAAAENMKAAQASANAVRAGLLPTIGASGSATAEAAMRL